MNLLSLFSNWKVLAGIILMLLVGAGVWYVMDLRSDKTQLQSQVISLESDITSARNKIEAIEKENKANLNSLKDYVADVQTLQNKNQKLKVELKQAGDNDEELERCLDYELPSAIIERLSEQSSDSVSN